MLMVSVLPTPFPITFHVTGFLRSVWDLSNSGPSACDNPLSL